MCPSIFPLGSLTALPAANLAAFGIKTAGVVNLMNLAPASPVPFTVQDGLAIPADASRGLAAADVRGAFDDLTSDMGSKGALLVRSSAIDEEPGQNITRFVAYERERADESFARFCGAIHEVGESKASMGVLLMPLVGGLKMLTDGSEALGWDNVSFVADSHSPFSPDEVFVAMVHGLGTRVVEAGDEFISMTAERSSGWISSIGNREEHFILQRGCGNAGVKLPEHYRQRSADFFSVADGVIKSALLSLGDAEYERKFKASSDWHFTDGKLMRIGGENAKLPPNLKENRDPRRHNMQAVGFIPLQRAEASLNLIGILQYLSEQTGLPVQIEGAYPDPESEIPVLYQMIDMPLQQMTKGKVPTFGADIVSRSVIGSCDFKGPLLFLNCQKRDFEYFEDVSAVIAELERRGEPYMLFAPDQNEYLIERTPNCRVRISGNTLENASSHPVSYTRLRQSREPSAGFTLAMGANILLRSLKKAHADYYDPKKKKKVNFVLYENAHARADGRRFSVYLEPSRSWPPRNALRRLLGRP